MASDLPIGFHIVKDNMSIVKALENAWRRGARACQIFIKNPQQFKLVKIPKEEINAILEFKKAHPIKIFIHSSYMINLGKPPKVNKLFLRNLENDMIEGGKFGADGVIVHMGKMSDIPSMPISNEQARVNMKESLNIVLERTANLTPPAAMLLLENTAMQRNEIGHQIEEMGLILNSVDKKYKNRIGMCLDTCHAYAANYSLATEADGEHFVNKVGQHIGWDRVKLIHLNDSQTPKGSGRDRHAYIDKGHIAQYGGNGGLQVITLHALRNGASIVSETVSEQEETDRQLLIVKSWAKGMANQQTNQNGQNEDADNDGLMLGGMIGGMIGGMMAKNISGGKLVGLYVEMTH